MYSARTTNVKCEFHQTVLSMAMVAIVNKLKDVFLCIVMPTMLIIFFITGLILLV